MKYIAIVTGASSGMGKEFVLQLPKWEQFEEIWVIARRVDRLEALKEQCTLPLRPIGLDLAKKEDLLHLSQLLETVQPKIGLLANIAGFGKFGSYERIPPQDNLDMIDLNCKAVVAMTDLCLPYMHKGAKILNLDSLSAFQPVPFINVYAATKAFILSYSRGLNRELKPRGIRVMSVNPGWVRTEFFDHAMQTNENAVNYFNKVYEPADVMATALKDLYRSKKDVSIHGFRIRWQVRLVKLLPHSLIMKIWLKQQGAK